MVVAFLLANLAWPERATAGAMRLMPGTSREIASASLMVRVSTLLVLIWPRRAAPGLTRRRFVPKRDMDSLTCIFAPSPMESMAMMEPTPIMMPSMVSEVLILLASMPLKAVRIIWRKSMGYLFIKVTVLFLKYQGTGRSEHKVGGRASEPRQQERGRRPSDISGERGGRGRTASRALYPKKRGSAQKASPQKRA